MGGGDKAAQVAKVHQHAALVIADHLAHGDLAGLQERLGQQPILALEGLGDAQEQGAVVILRRAADQHIYGLTLDQGGHKVGVQAGQVGLGHNPIPLDADVDQHFAGSSLDDDAFA